MINIDESKFKYLSKNKLHKQYLTNFLTEIWNVPITKLDAFIKEYYPEPSALEIVELNELRRIVELNQSSKDKNGNKLPAKLLNDDDRKWQSRRYDRMYGKEVQPVEVSGPEGRPVEISDMSKDQVNKELQIELERMSSVLKKIDIDKERKEEENKEKDE